MKTAPMFDRGGSSLLLLAAGSENPTDPIHGIIDKPTVCDHGFDFFLRSPFHIGNLLFLERKQAQRDVRTDKIEIVEHIGEWFGKKKNQRITFDLQTELFPQFPPSGVDRILPAEDKASG
jgi:hypothetical protein